jgi:DnaJ-class molecular chaperone
MSETASTEATFDYDPLRRLREGDWHGRAHTNRCPDCEGYGRDDLGACPTCTGTGRAL